MWLFKDRGNRTSTRTTISISSPVFVVRKILSRHFTINEFKIFMRKSVRSCPARSRPRMAWDNLRRWGHNGCRFFWPSTRHVFLLKGFHLLDWASSPERDWVGQGGLSCQALFRESRISGYLSQDWTTVRDRVFSFFSGGAMILIFMARVITNLSIMK